MKLARVTPFKQYFAAGSGGVSYLRLGCSHQIFFVVKQTECDVLEKAQAQHTQLRILPVWSNASQRTNSASATLASTYLVLENKCLDVCVSKQQRNSQYRLPEFVLREN